MYQILQSKGPQELVQEVKQFLEQNPNFKLYHGPYSDGNWHYQAVLSELKEGKQLLTD